MCHKRRDWSRTSSRASEPANEPADESADEREWWGVRAKKRLATFVSGEAGTAESEPETPTVAAESSRDERVEDEPEPDTQDEDEPDTEDEREPEPVLADD